MTAFISFQTRLGGQLDLTAREVEALAARAARGKPGASRIEEIWDRIMDWFLGTHLAEAKRHLARLYAPKAPDDERFMSFRELQRLAGGAFQDRFSIVPQAFGFALEINFGGGLPAYHQQITVCSQEYLATTWNRLVGDVLDPGRAREDRQRLFRQHEAQLMRDLPRTTYSIDGDRLDFAAPEGGKPNDPQLMLQIFRGVLLSGGTVTERQHTAVEVLASQGVFADVAASAMKHNGGKFDATEAANMMVGPEIELRLDITRSGDDIILHGKNVKGDISLPDGDVLKTSPMMLSKVTEFTLAIAPDGRVNVLSASFCGPAEA